MAKNNSNLKNKNKLFNTTNIKLLGQGKLPPQAIDFEEAVLGALMIDKNALNEVIDILEPECFYKEAHQEIYSVIKTLFANSQPIDILTVSDGLRKKNKLELCGGDLKIANLTEKVASSSHIEFHARIIVQKHIQRTLINVSSNIIQDAYDESTDVLDLLDKAESELFDIANGNIKKNYDSAQSLVREAIKRIEFVSKEEGLSGISSGFYKIDNVTAGWQSSDLIILAGRPGMGKTAFVLSMARNIAINYNTPIAFFSLEMSSIQLITRLISSETGLSSEKLRKGKLQNYEWQQLHSKIKKLEEAPLYIDDSPSLSIFDLRAKCRRLVSQNNVKIIVIDYLQLMTAGKENKGNREQEISTISRSLKSIAKELSIPVVALSQLSRAVETRGGSKRPLLSDLRESGAIEQDADIVSFIYRPEYYGLTEWDDDQGTPCSGQGEFIIAKHRNGGLDNIKLKFTASLAQFSNLEINNDFSNEFSSKMNN
ncbi:MAG: replicative DNA helicase [Flavobacteriales bacterium TMED288]|nr:replicative DNA helicase [Flavobacteriales bacterium]RPG53650.1 MAG: replicative DNA helicase [Flavobacteriales bacterium TMED288]|tara:strand:- start:5187 stop:6638 length:1452 start_codon:yes stop_codon:yes gene_type:complete